MDPRQRMGVLALTLVSLALSIGAWVRAGTIVVNEAPAAAQQRAALVAQSRGSETATQLVEAYVAAVRQRSDEPLAGLLALVRRPDEFRASTLGALGDARVLGHAFAPQRTKAVLLGQRLVYWLYTDVRIEDGGIASSRTLLVPAVRVADRWFLADVDERTQGLVSLGATSPPQ